MGRAKQLLIPTRAAGCEYLLQDEFTTARAAGAVNGTPTDPPGDTRVATDTGNRLSISGGAAQFALGGAGGDPGLWYSQKTHALGLMLAASVRFDGSSADNIFTLGWDTNQAGRPNATSLRTGAGGKFLLYNSEYGVAADNVGTYVTNTDYCLALVQRAAGSYVFIKGGIYTQWTHLWPLGTGAADWYPNISDYNRTAEVTYIRISQLAAPFDSAYDFATERLAGARSAGDTFAHEADYVGHFTVTTVPTGGQIEFWFRIQDSSNYWAVTVNAAGDLDLDEVVAGSPTQRATAAGVISNGDVITITADDETISVFDGNTRRIHYTSAANFKTEISGELDTEGTGGAVSDIVIYPRTLSGQALNELNKCST